MSIIESKEIQVASSETLAIAKGFKIVTSMQYSEAGEKLKGIMGLKRRIQDVFMPHIKRAFDAHKALVAEKGQHEAPLIEAEVILKRSMLAFQLEEERKRKELEAKAQEEARKEREKLEARAAKLEAKGKAEQAAALQVAAASVVAPMIAP